MPLPGKAPQHFAMSADNYSVPPIVSDSEDDSRKPRWVSMHYSTVSRLKILAVHSAVVYFFIIVDTYFGLFVTAILVIVNLMYSMVGCVNFQYLGPPVAYIQQIVVKSLEKKGS